MSPVRFDQVILFAGIALFAAGFVLALVFAMSRRDEGKGSKSLLRLATVLTGIGLVVVVFGFGLIFYAGLRH